MGQTKVIDSVSDERDGGFEKRGMDRSFHDITPDQYSFDPFGGAGYTFRGKPIASLDRVVDQLTYGNGRVIDNANNVITYTFAEHHLVGLYNNPNYGFTAGLGFTPFTDAQREAARESMQMWDDLVSATFRETNGRGADITLANSSDPAQAYAYPPVAGNSRATFSPATRTRIGPTSGLPQAATVTPR